MGSGTGQVVGAKLPAQAPLPQLRPFRSQRRQLHASLGQDGIDKTRGVGERSRLQKSPRVRHPAHYIGQHHHRWSGRIGSRTHFIPFTDRGKHDNVGRKFRLVQLGTAVGAVRRADGHLCKDRPGDRRRGHSAGTQMIRPRKHHHHVYVVELSDRVWNEPSFRRANPDHELGKPLVYVGMTGLEPDLRLDRHKAGIQANRFVAEYGLRLLPQLYEVYNPMPYEAAARWRSNWPSACARPGTVSGRPKMPVPAAAGSARHSLREDCHQEGAPLADLRTCLSSLRPRVRGAGSLGDGTRLPGLPFHATREAAFGLRDGGSST